MHIEMNLEEFHEKGFFECRLLPYYYRKVSESLDNLNWIKDDEQYNKTTKEMAMECPGTDKLDIFYKSSEELLKRAPDDIKDAIESILLGPYLDSWKMTFDFVVQYIDLWDGSEDIDWHWDGIDACDFFILIYETDEKRWLKEWGGQLEIAKRKIKDQKDYLNVRNEDVYEVIGEVFPNPRTLVIMNNKNPLIVHRPNRVIGDHMRRVLTAGFKLQPKPLLNSQSQVKW